MGMAAATAATRAAAPCRTGLRGMALSTLLVACALPGAARAQVSSCVLPAAQSCTSNVGSSEFCNGVAQNAQPGSIRASGLFDNPSCIKEAMSMTGSAGTLEQNSCEFLLQIFSFATTNPNGTEPSPVTLDPVSSMAPTLVLLLAYLLIPLSYFFAVVIIRKMLYAHFADPTAPAPASSKFLHRRHTSEVTSTDLDVPVFLSFHRLAYAVKLNAAGVAKAKAGNDGKVPTTPGWDQKVILNNVTGVFRPGTLSAIMGPSGCGKSTLLDVLADRKQGGHTRGKVLVNGRERTRLYKRLIGYVMQFDALFPHLTVREALMYTAELRIAGVDWHAKREAVAKVIKDLDLGRVADSRVGGNGIPGISGGQARRVTVGIELVTRPAILFLDEPTTGLDAFSSLQLVRTLRLLADTGRTVIATIHQPRPDIFALFNTLLLMKDGRIAYFGEVNGLGSYFELIGIHIPEESNAADFVVDLTYSKEKSGEGADTVQALADAYTSSQLAAQVEGVAHELETQTLPNLPPPAASLFGEVDPVTGEATGVGAARFSQSIFMQIFILLRRSYKNISRDRTYFVNVGLQMSQFLFYGLLFLGLRTEQVTEPLAGFTLGLTDLNYLFIIQQRAFLFQVMNTVMLIEVVVIASAFVEKTIFRREHASGAYSVFSYHTQFIVRFYVDAIWKGLLAATLSYFFPPMRLDPDAFFYFAAMLMLASTMGSSLAFLMVSLVPNAEGAANIHAQVLGTFGLYSGFFLFPPLLPVFMKWLYYMLPFKYSFEGLEINQFTCMTVGEQNQLFSVDPTLNRWTNMLVFMFYPPIFHICAMLATWAYTRPQSFWVRNCACCYAKPDPEAADALIERAASEPLSQSAAAAVDQPATAAAAGAGTEPETAPKLP